MPVTAALSIFCKDFSNFETVLLHNIPVLVDGNDFVQYFSPRKPEDVLWGGEYLLLMIQWKEVLSNIRRCRLDPVFLFSADCELRGQQFIYRMEKARRRKCAAPVPNSAISTALLELDLVFLETVLIELLNLEKCVHVRSPYCPRRSCAALAAALDCPLLSCSPEYFVLSAPARTRLHNGFNFIPFNLTDFGTPQPLTGSCSTAWPPSVRLSCQDAANGECHFLPAHRFVPELSCMDKVSEFYRPLLFLLLGSDSIPRIKLPAHVYGLISSFTGDYKTRRWLSLCSWLAQFHSSGSMEPISRILTTYSGDIQPLVAKKLAESVLTYIPSPTIAPQLAALLSQSTSLSTAWHSRVNEIPERQTPMRPNCSGSQSNTQFNLLQRLSGADFGSDVTVDFTSTWSPKLVEAFSQSTLSSKCISPIYVSPDILLSSHLELPDSDESVHESSLPLRLLHYRIFAGLKQSLTAPIKSVPTPFVVNEHLSAGPDLVCCSIPVKPLHLDSQRDGVDVILSRILGLVIPTDLANCGSLVNLSIALAIWHHLSEPKLPRLSSLTESPLALAVLVCAVATWFNCQCVEISEINLYDYYQNVASFAESQVTASTDLIRSTSKVSPAYRLEFVHAYNSLQLVYGSFRSLVALVNALNSDRNTSAFPSFAQTWILFPSGRLVHWIAACLANVDQPTRRHLAIRFWMPRLLYRSGTTNVSNPAQTLRDMSQEFNKLLDTACSVLPDQVPSLHVQCTRCPVPEVDFGEIVATSTNVKKDNSVKPPDPPKHPTTVPQKVLPKQGSEDQTNSNESILTGASKSRSSSISNLSYQPKNKNKARLAGRFQRTTGYAARLTERLMGHEKENKTDIP
ncbi:hypothetical protein FGIG_08281 [Fasciola gigantica]|uniref:Protein asteroid 1 n=1 Tax=Fasciola gigantica TaxID=46835 RepID=A0A504YJ49_FASGI|nr:hypothetical protein FGIG_08281 [Fasciola gigantica]